MNEAREEGKENQPFVERKTIKELLVDDALMDSFVLAYREVFGRYDPWGEYKECTACGKKYGVEEVLEIDDADTRSLAELEAGVSQEKRCLDPQCQGELKDMYSVAERRTLYEELAAKHPDMYCSLLRVGNNVEGFSLGWQDTPAGVWTERLQDFVREEQVDKERQKYEQSIASNRDEAIFYVDEIGLTPRQRRGVSPIKQLFLGVIGESQTPTVAFWTDKESKIYPLARAVGFNDLYVFSPDSIKKPPINRVVLSVPRVQLLENLQKGDVWIMSLIKKYYEGRV